MYIDDFTAEVKINETVIPDWTSFSVEERVGIAETTFNIELNRPHTITEGDTATISMGYGSSSTVLVDDKEIESQSGRSTSRSMGGAGTAITRKAPTKTVYFINETWLKQVHPNYYFRSGQVFSRETSYPSRKYNGVSIDRLFGDHLPGKNIRDAEVECILRFAVTYHDIARWIAEKLEYKLRISVPNLTVQRSFVVGSGTPYFQAISNLFSKYNPLIFIDKDRSGNKRINILDVGDDDQNHVSGSGVIGLTEDSFTVYEWNETNIGQEIDHLVINGVPSRWIYKYNSSMDGRKKINREKDLPGSTSTLTFTETFEEFPDMDDEVEKELWFEFSKGYELKVTRVQTVFQQKTDPMTGKTITTREQIISYRGDGTRVHASDTTYKYADYDTVIESDTVEYALLGYAGGGISYETSGDKITWTPDNTYWTKVMHRKVQFGDMIGQTGMRDTTITVNGLCYYTKAKKPVDGTDYYYAMGCRPVWIQNQIGATFQATNPSNDVGSYQDFLPISRETIRFDAVSPSLLRKVRTIETRFPMFNKKVYFEDVPIKREQRSVKEIEKRWEFYKINGTAIRWNEENPPAGEFHPKVELNEPDVVEAHEAEQIARRYMARASKNNKQGRIRLTAAVPGIKPGHTIKIPECTKTVFDWTSRTWQDEVEIAEQFLWVLAVRHVVQYTGNVQDTGRTREIYTELEVGTKY